MIPNTSDPIWETILKGDDQYNFESLPLGMLIARLRRIVKRNDSELDSCVNEAKVFFEKYESILEHDINLLFR